jgi:hypothetical protein
VTRSPWGWGLGVELRTLKNLLWSRESEAIVGQSYGAAAYHGVSGAESRGLFDTELDAEK